MSPTARERARAETIEQIKQIARGHLAVDGPNLSLRAVARDLGVVSSAVYRYFASRDELLTALIVDGYDALAQAVEEAEAAVPRRNVAGRWLAFGHAAREWALEQPHEYALLYGTPVPGYTAPADTADRPLLVLLGLLADAVERGAVELPSDRIAAAVRAEVAALAGSPGFEGVPVNLVARALTVWAQLHGTLGFEVFGHFPYAIDDPDAYFDHQLRVMARHLGLAR